MVFEFAGDAILRFFAEIFWRAKNTISLHSKNLVGVPPKKWAPPQQESDEYPAKKSKIWREAVARADCAKIEISRPDFVARA